MDFNEIKEIIKVEGGKFIIVEDGQPAIVVMSFDDYKRNLKLPLPEARKEEVLPIEKEEIPPEWPEGSLKIEDLPF